MDNGELLFRIDFLDRPEQNNEQKSKNHKFEPSGVDERQTTDGQSSRAKNFIRAFFKTLTFVKEQIKVCCLK